MWILLTILAVLLFLLSMPVTLTAAYDNEIHLKLQYLFVKVGILPSQADAKKEKKEKKPKKEKKADASAEHPKKKNKISLDFVLEILELVKQALSSLKNPLGWFLRRIRYRDIWLNITVCQEDAHQTALRYGQIQAVFHSVFSLLKNNIDIKTSDIQIRADFIGEEEKFAVGGKVRLRPINALIFVFWFAGSFAIGYLKRKYKESQLQKQLKKKQSK